MHFFKAFTLLATVAFAAVAVALPAAGTNAIAFKRESWECVEVVNIFNNVSVVGENPIQSNLTFELISVPVIYGDGYLSLAVDANTIVSLNTTL